jgi:hypothetical protein
MTPLIFIGIMIAVVAAIFFLINKGLGEPEVPKFDETPADVQKLDSKS